MQRTHCPICYDLLESREVMPCFICGGWEESVQKFDPAKRLKEFELPDDTPLVLCNACELDEFMTSAGWGWQLNLPKDRLPIVHLRFARNVAEPVLTHDKYCANCRLRLAFLKILAKVKDEIKATS